MSPEPTDPRAPAAAARGPRPARTGVRGTPRRATHSLEQILSAAIGILDREGTKGLTLRGLATELGGGLGSVYWYVDGREDLLSLACDALVGEALARTGTEARSDGPELETDDPTVITAVAELRGTALALFEQTQLHAWLAPQLQVQDARSPNALRLWERLGRPLASMGLSPRQQFDGSTAISGYVVGVAAEMTAQDQHVDHTRSQAEQLEEIAAELLATDPVEFAWIHSIVGEFRGHDDRDQFAAGLDLLLGGLVRQTVQRPAGHD